MFTHGFPYTNFHDLNLDWIIKTVKILFNKSVFSINNIEPDDDGNVTITGAELGAVSTINNIAPIDGNVTLTASDVGAIALGQGVTKVNGFGPDSSGNVLSGTVRSINGISPASLPTPGNVVLNASDVGALPSTIDPVETVNGISPDANGNVNVGTVKSVNGSTPDAQGNVNLPTVAGVTSVDGVGPDSDGNVQLGNVYVKTVNGISPTNGNITLTAENVNALSLSSISSGVYYVDGNTGNDNNNGKSWNTAFKTIWKALQSFRLGANRFCETQIIIKAGTYQENMLAFVEGNNSGLILKADSGEVIIEGYLNWYGGTKITFQSTDSSQYGFTFKRIADITNPVLALSHVDLTTYCNITFDFNNALYTPYCGIHFVNGCKVVLDYLGKFKIQNQLTQPSFRIAYSEIFFASATIEANNNEYIAEHSIVGNIPTGWTHTGTSLEI